MTSYLMKTYNPIPVTLEKGQGVWVWDKNGKKYLDAFAGIAVSNLGHNHPHFIKSLEAAMQQVLHTSNILTIEVQEVLAKSLCDKAGMQQVFFGNSGAEANECAIKLARMYGHKKGIACPTIIVAENSFHGRTLATLTASGSRKVQAGFEPLVQGFVRAPYNDLAALAAIAQNNQDIVAILMEPLQGEGGIRVANKDYLAGIRALCDQHDWLMMVDEVQTGMGRTGQWFGFQHQSAVPDVITLAKALGNGVPIGACLTRDKAVDLFHVGNHGSTFGGNPFSCRAALAVLEAMEQEGLPQHAAVVGKYLLDKLTEKLRDIPGVVGIRGLGLMIGIELEKPCREILQLAADQGLLVSITAEKVIRLLPPLVLQQEEADEIANILLEIIPQFYAL